MILVGKEKSNELQDIGRKYKTDKGSHNYKGVTYLHVYDLYLRHFRDQPINILELGVKNGASLRMWKEYFPQAQVFGLDLNRSCKKYEEDRIIIEIGYQDSTTTMKNLVAKARGKFDIILDDCSHINELTIKSFNFLWPYVNKDGYYIIEDLRNSYTKDIGADMKKGGWQYGQKKETKLINVRADMDKLFLKLIKEMDYRNGSTSSVHFYPMLCVIGKV